MFVNIRTVWTKYYYANVPYIPVQSDSDGGRGRYGWLWFNLSRNTYLSGRWQESFNAAYTDKLWSLFIWLCPLVVLAQIF